jgi:hypothetical protein
MNILNSHKGSIKNNCIIASLSSSSSSSSTSTVFTTWNTGGQIANWQSVSMADNGTSWAIKGTGGIWKSTDSGQTWSVSTTAVSTTNTAFVSLICDQTNGNSVYVTGNANQYCVYTTNGGSSWSTDTGANVGRRYFVTGSPDLTRMVCTSSSGALYRTNNLTGAWSKSNQTTLTGGQFSINDYGLGLFISGTKVLYSSSNGSTWTQITSLSASWTGVAFSNPAIDNCGVGLVSSSGSIVRSIDNGTTWSTISGTTNKAWTGVSVSKDGQYALACSASNGIWASNDYGASFNQTSASTSNNYSGIFISRSGSKGLAYVNSSTSGYIFYSTL